MGKTVQIICDGCAHDITTTGNCEDYRLVLLAESKPGYGGGAYTSMAISPPVDRAFYFCGLQCLDHWRGRKHHEAALWKEWNAKWKEERGTRKPDGSIYSYPCPPHETTAALHAEFERAALAAFPMKRIKQ